MSCILRISGRNLDVDKLVQKSSLKPYQVYRRGQPLFQSKPKGKKLQYSGAKFDVSNADFNEFEKQIKDCVRFLSKHKFTLRKLISYKGVDSAILDFGVEIEMGHNNIAFQSEFLPHEILKAAGDLKIGIEISHYPYSAK